jgi:hypothetical protein
MLASSACKLRILHGTVNEGTEYAALGFSTQGFYSKNKVAICDNPHPQLSFNYTDEDCLFFDSGI